MTGKTRRVIIGLVMVLAVCLLALFQGSRQEKIPAAGRYTLPEDVALYIHTYEKLPSNYITKAAAKELGWKSEQGNLWDVSDELSIGGDEFLNLEGLLPTAPGRRWYECDVYYEGGFRGPHRIVYSSDGLIFYTDDHYASFEQLY